MSPVITVLLPTYNAAAWLGAAIDSLLHQSYRDFELLVIDDGSTDRTPSLLNTYKDDRIRVLRHEHNSGLIASLNHGIDVAKGKFIARMDADDICMPQRFERQLLFLKTHPEVSICGTWMREFGARGALCRPPVDPEHLLEVRPRGALEGRRVGRPAGA